MATALVTGSNRGIGLELCKQLKAKGYKVIGTCRQSSEELRQAAERVIEGIDLGSDGCVGKLAQELRDTRLDVVINNAGLLEKTSLENFAFDAIARQFNVNAIGPLRVVKAILPFMGKGGRVLNVTSRMGSIADNTSGGSYGYRMSKAALNMATVSLAHDLKEKGIAAAVVHPGYVKTRMTGHSGDLTPEESARGILARLEELSPETSGFFRHAKGETLPW